MSSEKRVKGMTGWDSNIPKKRSRATGDEADADWPSAHTFSDETSPTTQLFKYAFQNENVWRSRFFISVLLWPDDENDSRVPSPAFLKWRMKIKTSSLHDIRRKRQTRELNQHSNNLYHPLRSLCCKKIFYPFYRMLKMFESFPLVKLRQEGNDSYRIYQERQEDFFF